MAALLTTAKRRKNPKCPSTNDWTPNMWSIRTMEHHSTVERQEALTRAMLRVN